MAIPPTLPYEIVLRAKDPEGEADAEELANLLRDLVFLHDRLWIIASGQYIRYPLDASFFYTRKGRSIPPNQHLKLALIRKESPLEVGLIIMAAIGVPAAAWAFFQIIRGARLLPGEIRIQRLQEQKLQRELQGKTETGTRLVLPEHAPDLTTVYNQEIAGRRKAPDQREMELRLLRRDVKRIAENAFQITEIEIKRTVEAPASTQRASEKEPQ